MGGRFTSRLKSKFKTMYYGSTVYYGDPSYMYCVKWDDFVSNLDKQINKAYEIRD